MITAPRSRPLRRRAAAAALLLPLALTACGGEAEPQELAAVPTAAPSVQAPTGEPAPSAGVASPSQAADEESATTVTLTVAGGTVTGDTGRAPVGLGDRVRLTVTADVADEVHVHGYDLHLDTAVGQAATLEFVADRPGVFEVELEESRVLLTRLQVQ